MHSMIPPWCNYSLASTVEKNAEEAYHEMEKVAGPYREGQYCRKEPHEA